MSISAVLFNWLDCLTCPRFDSSDGRGDFITEIGVGRVIKGMASYDAGVSIILTESQVGTMALLVLME